VFHAFDRIGVSEQVRAAADSPAAVLMFDALDGKELVRIPTGASFRARFKHPYIIVHRIDLHNILLDACRRNGAIELVPDAMVTACEERGTDVAVTTADGRLFSGTALVAADGFRSLFRAQLIGDGEPRPIGYVALRTIVPMTALHVDVPRDCVVLWAGPGFHIVHYPLRHGTLFNVVAVFRTATFAERLDPQAYTAEVCKTYAGAHPVMKTLTDMMDLERRWIIADRDPIRHWGRGHVTLLGDAAHPVLQSFAQGACMAIEDGVVLGELVEQAKGDIASAFERYQNMRLLRTARLALESRAMWTFYHAEGIARDVRNDTCARQTEDDVFRCLAWLYDGIELPKGA
jgi:salicylate hydroxylase